jgi:hypothetical protein
VKRLIVLSVSALGLLATNAIAAPPADPAPRTWASCVEHVPSGTSRPELVESFPARGTSGYASTLEVTVKHGRGETVLPEGFKVQGGSDAARALASAGFVIPDPNGGVGPKLTVAADGSSTTIAIPFLALPKEPGRHAMMLPPVPIAIGRASGELVTLCTKPHALLVEDPIANEATPTVRTNPLPRAQREEWVVAEQVLVGVIAGVALALLVAYLLKRRKRQPKLEPVIPPKLPWIAALEELEELRRSTLLEERRTDAYFDRVSDCVRRYLGARYGFDGLETTTDEMRGLLKRVRPPVPELATIAAFLEDCDLVKFARLVPTDRDCVEALERGERIVRNTTPASALTSARFETRPAGAA